MSERLLIPHIVFSAYIRRVHSLEAKEKDLFPYWQLDWDEVRKEVKKTKPFLTQLASRHQREPLPVYAWFVVEETMAARHIRAIQEELTEELQNLWGKAVRVHPRIMLIAASPYSLPELLTAIEPLVHQVSLRHPFARLGQIVGTGEALPAQALFMEGIRQWEERYVSLYMEHDTVYHVPTTIQHPKEWLKQFRQFLEDYDYAAALALLKEWKPQGKTAFYEGIAHLLLMNMDRLNFAFHHALEHADSARSCLPHDIVLEDTYDILRQLTDGQEQEKELARIVELYRHLDLYLDMNDLPAFFVRFYRVREAILLYLYRYARIEEEWEGVMEKKGVHFIIDTLEELYDQWELDGYYGAYFYMKSQNVTDTLLLRNRSFVGHGRRGYGMKDVWVEYGGYAGADIKKVKKRFLCDTSLLLRDLGTRLDENFLHINRYILRLVTGEVTENEETAASPMD